MAPSHLRLVRLALAAAAAVMLGGCRDDQGSGPLDESYDEDDPLGLGAEDQPRLPPGMIPPPEDPIVAESLELTAAGGAAIDLADGPGAPSTAPGEGPVVASRTVDVKVERGESLKLYSDWSGIPESELVPALEGKPLRAGKTLGFAMTPDQFQRFTDSREKYRLAREREFLERYELEKLLEHKVAKGDSLSSIAKLGGDNVPVWLLKRLNRNLDLEHLRIGETVLVPKLREVAERGERVGENLWEKAEKLNVERLTHTGAAPGPRPDAAGPKKPALSPTTIRVKEGETLRMLASWAGLPAEQILRDNPTLPGDRAPSVGQSIVLNIPEGHTADFLRQRTAHHTRREEARRLFDLEPQPAVGGGTAEREIGGGSDRRPILGANVKLKTVKVVKGDTLDRIAKKHGVTVKALRAVNPGLKRLRPGGDVQVPVKRAR